QADDGAIVGDAAQVLKKNEVLVSHLKQRPVDVTGIEGARKLVLNIDIRVYDIAEVHGCAFNPPLVGGIVDGVVNQVLILETVEHIVSDQLLVDLFAARRQHVGTRRE